MAWEQRLFQLTSSRAGSDRRGRRGLAWTLSGVALVLFYLNGSLAFQNLWPTPWIRLVPELAVEVLVLLALLALLRSAGWRPGRRAKLSLAVLLLLAVVLRYTEVTAPPLFGRALNLYWDVRHLPNLIELFWRSMALPGVLMVLLGVPALVALSVWLNWRCLAFADRILGWSTARRVAVALPILAGLVYAASFVPGLGELRRAFSVPASVIAAKQIGLAVEAHRLRHASPEELDALFGPRLAVREEPVGLDGENIFIVFLESYGTTLFDTPDYATAIAPAFEAFAARLEAAGWHAASRRLISPTFGGGSWFAHGTLLSGARLSDQSLYNLFLTTGRETLVSRFEATGYRTVALMPGTQRQWPEGAAFGFDRIYDAKALNYRGPDFGYWRIPDQFSLHRLREAELTQIGQPLFALVVLISSHMPFHPLPPYVEDWSLLGSGIAYDPEETAALVAQEPDWSRLGVRYARAMADNFALIGDYLENAIPANSLVVLVGDHQPPGIVAGKNQPWTVPIHILSRAPTRLEPFLDQGYQAGLRPTAESTIFMEDFTRAFLAALGSNDRSSSRRPGE